MRSRVITRWPLICLAHDLIILRTSDFILFALSHVFAAPVAMSAGKEVAPACGRGPATVGISEPLSHKDHQPRRYPRPPAVQISLERGCSTASLGVPPHIVRSHSPQSLVRSAMARENPLRTSASPKDISLSGPSMNSESLLSYPDSSSIPEDLPLPAPAQPRKLLKDRLYVGNLHPTVDESVFDLSILTFER